MCFIQYGFMMYLHRNSINSTIKIIMSLVFKRYGQQSTKNQSAFINSLRNTSSKSKISALNVSSSLSKNPQVDLKLPSLSRSSMRKSFSTFESDRNTKFKLQTLQEKLQEIKHNLHSMRQQTKQSLQFSACIKQNLINRQLSNMHKDLKQQITGLHNLVKSTASEHRSRSDRLRDSCNKLWDSNETLKNSTFELRMRIQALERNMGFKQ